MVSPTHTPSRCAPRHEQASPTGRSRDHTPLRTHDHTRSSTRADCHRAPRATLPSEFSCRTTVSPTHTPPRCMPCLTQVSSTGQSRTHASPYTSDHTRPTIRTVSHRTNRATLPRHRMAYTFTNGTAMMAYKFITGTAMGITPRAFIKTRPVRGRPLGRGWLIPPVFPAMGDQLPLHAWARRRINKIKLPAPPATHSHRPRRTAHPAPRPRPP